MRLIKHNCTYILFRFQLEIKNNPAETAVIPQIGVSFTQIALFFRLFRRNVLRDIPFTVIVSFIHVCLFSRCQFAYNHILTARATPRGVTKSGHDPNHARAEQPEKALQPHLDLLRFLDQNRHHEIDE